MIVPFFNNLGLASVMWHPVHDMTLCFLWMASVFRGQASSHTVTWSGEGNHGILKGEIMFYSRFGWKWVRPTLSMTLGARLPFKLISTPYVLLVRVVVFPSNKGPSHNTWKWVRKTRRTSLIYHFPNVINDARDAFLPFKPFTTIYAQLPLFISSILPILWV